MGLTSRRILCWLVYGFGIHALPAGAGVEFLPQLVTCPGNLKVELKTKVSFSPATPMPELESLFQCTEGWTGADGAYSLPISSSRTLWLYGDTCIGKVVEGKRVAETMVTSTVAIQEGMGKDAKVRFFIRHGEDGKPAAILTPKNEKGWFWLRHGALVGERLYLFLAQIDKTNDPGVFGFRQIGQWIGVIPNPQDEPLSWCIDQLEVPATILTSTRELSFGSAVLESDGFLYIYGTDQDFSSPTHDRYLVVARAPVESVTDFATWRFYNEGRWDPDYHACSPLVGGMATECSVSFLPKFGCYALVYTELGMSPKILVRSAPTPWGPWSEATTVYECPETRIGKDVFCYAAKAHPEISGPDELIITYAANSFDFSQLFNDARLYWPKFVRVGVSRGEDGR